MLKKRRDSKKEEKHILNNLNSNWTILVQDESIFVYDYVIRMKKWIIADKRQIVVTVTATGYHKRTIVLGCLSQDGKKLFKQYGKFNSNTVVNYLKHLQK